MKKVSQMGVNWTSLGITPAQTPCILTGQLDQRPAEAGEADDTNPAIAP